MSHIQIKGDFMNKININNIDGELFVECPYCMVYSVKLSSEEKSLVEAGQLMMAVCQVCNKEIILNG